MIIAIGTWIVIGVVIGAIGCKFVDLRGDSPLFAILAAVGGSVVASILYALISGAGVRPWDLWGLTFASLGAIVGAIAFHIIRARFITRERFSVRQSY
jgi:uncharacterized membrane protein YeaQ/YmgE (transglycosylase-associated protein family)